MAIMILHWGQEWNQELYDQLMDKIIPDPSDPPDGLIAHFGGPDERGAWRVTDVWESEEAWERFRDETLMPAAQEMEAPSFNSSLGQLHNKIVGEGVTA